MARTILFNAAGRVRAGWRVLIFFALFLVLGPLGGVLLSFAYDILPTGDAPPQRMNALGFQLLAYGTLLGATLLASAVCLRWLDRRPFQSLGYQWRQRGWCEYLVGFGLAALMITIVVLIELPLGHVDLQWEGRPAAETASGTLQAFFFFNVAAAFEEFLFRGYPLQTLLLDVRPTLAVSAPSLLFGLGHAGNPNASALGVFNTVLAGVWLSIAYMKTHRLWLPIGLHAGWNFTMSTIYGLTVSGIEERIGTSLFRASQTGPAWLTGGSYGPEGGVLVTVVLIGASLWLWRTPRLRPHEETHEPLARG
ncbi:MAG: CPBP family intramembrane metalloprotease [Blastocatellia bacterium]|nr:CPBP family intramembrane metalloprotease [Blastocatellia bacterium]